MEQANIRAALEAKHRELLGGIGSREDIRIQNAADPFDNLQLQMNREVVIRKLDSDSGLLRQISSALKRLEEGSFGICLECEEQIPVRRLQVLPWAAHCVPARKKRMGGRRKLALHFGLTKTEAQHRTWPGVT